MIKLIRCLPFQVDRFLSLKRVLTVFIHSFLICRFVFKILVHRFRPCYRIPPSQKQLFSDFLLSKSNVLALRFLPCYKIPSFLRVLVLGLLPCYTERNLTRGAVFFSLSFYVKSTCSQINTMLLDSFLFKVLVILRYFFTECDVRVNTMGLRKNHRSVLIIFIETAALFMADKL